MAQLINKEALVEELQLHDLFADVSKAKTKEFIEDFFKSIQNHVSNGNTVKIPGFGKWDKYTKQDGTFKPRFTSYDEFKALVNA